MAPHGPEPEKSIIHNTPIFFVINPNKPYNKRVWHFAQEVVMGLSLSSRLLYCFKMRYEKDYDRENKDPEAGFFFPTEEEINKISDKIVIECAGEVGEVEKRLHWNINIFPYYHTDHVHLDQNKVVETLAEIVNLKNEKHRADDREWLNIELPFYVDIPKMKNRAPPPVAAARYLRKVQPPAKQVLINCSYLLPDGTVSMWNKIIEK
jgi:hypothetical protein